MNNKVKLESGTWGEFLTECGFCKENPLTGNRPCDNGTPCDKCHEEWVGEMYVDWKKGKVKPISTTGVERGRDLIQKMKFEKMDTQSVEDVLEGGQAELNALHNTYRMQLGLS